MKNAIEILIGAFAGYCCAYFISHKFMKMTPTELIIEFLEVVKKRLGEIIDED